MSRPPKTAACPPPTAKGVLSAAYICGDLGERIPQHRVQAVSNPDFHFAQVSQGYDSWLAGGLPPPTRHDRPHLLRQRQGLQSLLDATT